jgi:hypothetical protein
MISINVIVRRKPGRLLGSRKKFLPFSEARAFAHSMKFSTSTVWRLWTATEQRPADIPANPHVVYEEEWVNWSDWLGYPCRTRTTESAAQAAEREAQAKKRQLEKEAAQLKRRAEAEAQKAARLAAAKKAKEERAAERAKYQTIRGIEISLHGSCLFGRSSKWLTLEEASAAAARYEAVKKYPIEGFLCDKCKYFHIRCDEKRFAEAFARAKQRAREIKAHVGGTETGVPGIR